MQTVPSPAQCPAPAYGSAFSRDTAIKQADLGSEQAVLIAYYLKRGIIRSTPDGGVYLVRSAYEDHLSAQKTIGKWVLLIVGLSSLVGILLLLVVVLFQGLQAIASLYLPRINADIIDIGVRNGDTGPERLDGTGHARGVPRHLLPGRDVERILHARRRRYQRLAPEEA